MIEVIKDDSLKISPGGVVSLPREARDALGMKSGTGMIVGVSTEKEAIVLTGDPRQGSYQIRVSKGGQAVLLGDAHDRLSKAPGRHFRLELDAPRKTVKLLAF
jgi:hypothetical protein